MASDILNPPSHREGSGGTIPSQTGSASPQTDTRVWCQTVWGGQEVAKDSGFCQHWVLFVALCEGTLIMSPNLSVEGAEVTIVPLFQLRAPRGGRIGASHSDAVTP